MSSTSTAAVLAATSTTLPEVKMHKALMIERAPEAPFSGFLLRRTGQADLLLEKGCLLLVVKTEPAAGLRLQGVEPTKRWKEYRLFVTPSRTPAERYGKLVVAEEGHSTKEGETTRYDAKVCTNAVEVWEAMGKIDSAKELFAELGLPVVVKVS